MDTTQVKKAMLQKKRMELRLDEYDVQILDLENDITKVNDAIVKTREEIKQQEQVIADLKNEKQPIENIEGGN